MKKVISFSLFTSIALSLLCASVFAQRMPEIPESNRVLNEKTEMEKYDEEVRRNRNQPLSSREDRVLKEGWLAPSEADRLAFAEFLHLRNTGLIRLLPRQSYDSEGSYTAKPEKIRGGGSYYSFANLTHVYGYGSDIGLEQNHLSVGFAGASYGMLTNLGDVSIEEITLKDPLAQFLSGYEPPALEPEARAEARRFWVNGGVVVDGLLYQRRMPVQEDATYLLRSIDYERTDVFVAIRVVRKDSDGSIIIAWKLLKSFPVTMLKRSE
jgi:hypothetical protein